jgi:hypothetical protein
MRSQLFNNLSTEREVIMAKLKDAQLNPYLYNTEQGLPVWKMPSSANKAIALRNSRWHENMPDLTGQALADAQRDFINEADDMPLWIQLELDLWEGQHGIGAFTAWDLADGGNRG